MPFAKAAKYKETRAWIWARSTWLGELSRVCKSCRRELKSWARSEPADFRPREQLAESIRALRNCASETGDSGNYTEAPIFLLSTGWRAGSTLLQRILVTDPRLLVWGEPFGEMGLVSRVADMVSSFLSPRDLQLWYEQSDSALSSLTTSWIATLSPSGDEFRSALRSLFDQWLGEPARRRGFARWGLKEVRLGPTEASLLYWLFPRAKFVILSRHPYDCYRSFAGSGWERLYYRYPEVRIDSAAAFARHWNRLVVGLSDLPAGFPSFRVKYEDLVSRQVNFRELESWLGIEIREDLALSASVGGTAVRSRLNWVDRFVIAREAHAGMHALGYSE